MTKEEKITYMSLATRICGFNFKPQHLDLLVTAYDQVILTEGNTTLQELVKIEVEIKEKYKITEIEKEDQL